MSKKRKIADLPDFDPAKFLQDDEDIAAYLTVVIEENDPSLLAAALGDIPANPCIKHLGRMPSRDLTQSTGYVQPLEFVWSPNLLVLRE